jgi:hypothetical protein
VQQKHISSQSFTLVVFISILAPVSVCCCVSVVTLYKSA